MQEPQQEPHEELRLKGIAVSPGVVYGPLVIITHEEFLVEDQTIKPEDVPAEMARLEAALMKTREQIMQIKDHISSSIGEKDASIFDAHLLVVEDSSLLEAVKRQLTVKLRSVESVYHHLMMAYAKSMRELDDPYLQERASDLVDVGRRVLNNLMGRKMADSYQLSQPSIILAHDLSPSDTALLDRAKVLGFATEVGSPTSHTAIMARSLNIPAVVGLRDAIASLKGSHEIILDGYDGTLIIDPTVQTKYEYGQIERRRHEVEAKLGELRGSQAHTRDQRRVLVSANVELPEDVPLIHEAGAEGIGLYRTEFLFLNRLQIPSEDEQYETYMRVIANSGEYGTIVRTLDLGGDKMPSSIDLGQENNPFLGWRAIRYCLDQVEVFRTQLRAICRAGHGYKTRIMFPMIATIEELVKSRQLLAEVQQELRDRNIPQCEALEVGAMIEIPSSAMIVDLLVDHVDFFSVGTNDLIGYTLAVDRTNEKVAYLYQPAHPAIIRLLKRVAEVAHAKGKWVGVCGETAGDVKLTPMFVGLGIDELSMGSIFIPRVKKAVQCLDYGEMKALIEEVTNIPDGKEIEKKFLEVAHKNYPELLI